MILIETRLLLTGPLIDTLKIKERFVVKRQQSVRTDTVTRRSVSTARPTFRTFPRRPCHTADILRETNAKVVGIIAEHYVFDDARECNVSYFNTSLIASRRANFVTATADSRRSTDIILSWPRSAKNKTNLLTCVSRLTNRYETRPT